VAVQARPRSALEGEAREQLLYSDAKVANRDIRIWHLVIENGIE
jgi:hypothetical protein